LEEVFERFVPAANLAEQARHYLRTDPDRATAEIAGLLDGMARRSAKRWDVAALRELS
jgi:hypothetical protein